MSGPIKRRVEDADILINAHRYEGALAQLLIAVAASSTKLFPAGTASIDAPAKKPGKFKEMGDGEKFKRFLGVRIRKLLFNDPFLPEDGRHASLIGFVQGLPHPEEVLYDQYRNAIIHEGQLPPGLIFSPEVATENSIGISFDDAGVSFSSGLLTLLRRAVTEAPVNGKEFGLAHYRLFPKAGAALEDIESALARELQTTPGRVAALLSILQEIGPASNKADDKTLRNLAAPLTIGGRATGLRTAFYGPPICDINNELTDHGIYASRRLLALFDYVDIAK